MMLRQTFITVAAALGFTLAAAPVAEAGHAHHTTVNGYIQSFGYGYHDVGFGYGFPCYQDFGFEGGYMAGCPGVKQPVFDHPANTTGSNFYPASSYHSSSRGQIYWGNRRSKHWDGSPIIYHSYSEF